MLKTNQHSLKEKDSEGFIVTFITTFTTVFVAELGDKTQVATLLLSAQSGTPIIVFIGASLALIVSSLIGVLLGRFIYSNIPNNLFDITAGSLMVLIGFWILFELTGLGGINLYLA